MRHRAPILGDPDGDLVVRVLGEVGLRRDHLLDDAGADRFMDLGGVVRGRCKHRQPRGRGGQGSPRHPVRKDGLAQGVRARAARFTSVECPRYRMARGGPGGQSTRQARTSAARRAAGA